MRGFYADGARPLDGPARLSRVRHVLDEPGRSVLLRGASWERIRGDAQRSHADLSHRTRYRFRLDARRAEKIVRPRRGQGPFLAGLPGGSALRANHEPL